MKNPFESESSFDFWYQVHYELAETMTAEEEAVGGILTEGYRWGTLIWQRHKNSWNQSVDYKRNQSVDYKDMNTKDMKPKPIPYTSKFIYY